MSSTDTEPLRVERVDDGALAVVTLTAPTMPPPFFAACERVFTDLAADPALRAVVVRGGGKAFSYGLDLAQAFAAWGPQLSGGGLAASRTATFQLVKQLQRSFNAVAACPAPVIAAIHGWCIGGGLDLISACDIRLCAADARFSLRETRVAMVADLGSLQRLPRILSPGHLRELAFTGKDIDAARAEKIGLVNDVLPDRDALDAAALALARDIAAAPPLVVRGVKHVLEVGDGKSVADGLDYVAAWNSAFLASEDLGEAVAAFAQKRPPVFKGK
ncbi:MAG: crotonase/enoyl-CoA hydratase family protein [Kofleriaceae bacterium]|nr:crotonase/enoyl-CoA hydratase family protein [Myxococcales bacterium]MCB9563410.1 crotonase/enoyl-CoA hydratase family protein [Kofleriaceae bacterium]